MYNPTDDKKMNFIEDMIRETEIPEYSLSSKIIERLGETPMKKAPAQGSTMKKTLIATATAAALGLGFVGTGFISPVMADTLSKIPLVGSLFQDSVDINLKSAASNSQIKKLGISDTHEGATFTVAEAYHDGERLSIALTLDGLTLKDDAIVGDYQSLGHGQFVTEEFSVLINGEPFNGMLDIGPIINSDHSVQKNAALLRITSKNGQSLPDQFELSIRSKLHGIDDYFEFQVPVSKE